MIRPSEKQIEALRDIGASHDVIEALIDAFKYTFEHIEPPFPQDMVDMIFMGFYRGVAVANRTNKEKAPDAHLC